MTKIQQQQGKDPVAVDSGQANGAFNRSHMQHIAIKLIDQI